MKSICNAFCTAHRAPLANAAQQILNRLRFMCVCVSLVLTHALLPMRGRSFKTASLIAYFRFWFRGDTKGCPFPPDRSSAS